MVYRAIWVDLLLAINPIKPRGAESAPPSGFLSVNFYQVHLQH